MTAVGYQPVRPSPPTVGWNWPGRGDAAALPFRQGDSPSASPLEQLRHLLDKYPTVFIPRSVRFTAGVLALAKPPNPEKVWDLQERIYKAGNCVGGNICYK